jgi:hypothetical protein
MIEIVYDNIVFLSIISFFLLHFYIEHSKYNKSFLNNFFHDKIETCLICHQNCLRYTMPIIECFQCNAKKEICMTCFSEAKWRKCLICSSDNIDILNNDIVSENRNLYTKLYTKLNLLRIKYEHLHVIENMNLLLLFVTFVISYCDEITFDKRYFLQMINYSHVMCYFITQLMLHFTSYAKNKETLFVKNYIFGIFLFCTMNSESSILGLSIVLSHICCFQNILKTTKLIN